MGTGDYPANARFERRIDGIRDLTGCELMGLYCVSSVNARRPCSLQSMEQNTKCTPARRTDSGSPVNADTDEKSI